MDAINKGMFGEKKDAEFNEKNTCLTVKHRGGLIMLWACVAASGTGNFLQVKERMDSIIIPANSGCKHHTICKKS
ncbi:hypothetical protein P3447_27630, partial [Vibrio parahaemolyticus]|nr:hypothetical protein [Vibrio parahaemolyticus]